MRKALIITLAAVSLTGCQTASMGTKEGIGTVGGAIAGGLAGSQLGKGNGKLVAVGVGALAGAFVGREIGASLDRADLEQQANATRRALSNPRREPVRWSGPRSGNSGTVTVTREGQAATGEHCREYQQTIVVGGKTERAFGAACQAPDGSWRVAG